MNLTYTVNKSEQLEAHYGALHLCKNNDNYWPNALSYNTGTIHENIAQDAHSILSEYVVAKIMGYKFDFYAQKGKRIADVGEIYEVKHTKHTNGHLIVHHYDREGDIAILVTGAGPTYTIKGAITVRRARTQAYKHPTQPNYWVPGDSLLCIDCAHDDLH